MAVLLPEHLAVCLARNLCENLGFALLQAVREWDQAGNVVPTFLQKTGTLSWTRICFSPSELCSWRCQPRTGTAKTSVKTKPEFSALLFSMALQGVGLGGAGQGVMMLEQLPRELCCSSLGKVFMSCIFQENLLLPLGASEFY